MVVQGKGVESDGVVVNELATFIVDALHAGKAGLDVAVVDERSCETLSVDIQRLPRPADAGPADVASGPDAADVGSVYRCSYRPCDAVRHSVIVTYGHVTVPHSPFKVRLSHPDRQTYVHRYMC